MIAHATPEQRQAVLEAWLDRLITSYPERTARFLASKHDQFANPVGADMRKVLSALTDAFFSGVEPGELDAVLHPLIRVRAVQEMSPGAAVAFVLHLRDVVREQFHGQLGHDEIRAVNAWVEALLLVAFGVYVACRDQMHDIRVKAIRKQSITVIERLNAWRTDKYGDQAEEGS
jgi:hypothetical protein